jgi:hypothetical protein
VTPATSLALLSIIATTAIIGFDYLAARTHFVLELLLFKPLGADPKVFLV